jgi:hypothetical protein
MEPRTVVFPLVRDAGQVLSAEEMVTVQPMAVPGNGVGA